MGEKFNAELQKAEKLSKYNMSKASRLLDDMATAYLSTDFDGLDKSLVAVKTAKKAMRAQGIRQDIIDDFFLQRSYLSKTTLRSLVNDSIYMGDTVIVIPTIENRIASHNDKTTTDLIIDFVQSRPDLLSCLQRGTAREVIAKKFQLSNTTLLINFYNRHKEIIDN